MVVFILSCFPKFMLLNDGNTKYFITQSCHSFSLLNTPWKKTTKVTKEDSDMDIFPRTKTIYEDMKAVTGTEPKFKWGKFIK